MVTLVKAFIPLTSITATRFLALSVPVPCPVVADAISSPNRDLRFASPSGSSINTLVPELFRLPGPGPESGRSPSIESKEEVSLSPSLFPTRRDGLCAVGRSDDFIGDEVMGPRECSCDVEGVGDEERVEMDSEVGVVLDCR